MKYRKVIFNDPGTSFGWAVWEDPLIYADPRKRYVPSQKEFTSGAMTLSSDPGPRVSGFWWQLHANTGYRLHEVCEQEEGIYRNPGQLFIAWEEAAFTGHSKADRLYGTWEGLLVLFCELHKIPYMAINGSTIKAYAKEKGFYLGPKERKLLKPKDRKPKPRPEWILASKPKLQEHEIDARWGLEYLLTQLRKEK